MDQASKLRELVQANQDVSSARVIAVTSGKGGVGKTTLSVNIALEMAKRGKKVVIFDADFGLANVEVMLGIRPQFNLLDLIHNNKTMSEIITNGPDGIGFISGGSGVSELAALDNASIKLLISELVKLDQMYDVVIIDTGAGITDSVMEFVMMSPEVLLVVTPEPTSITDSYSLLKVLRRKNSFNPIYKTIHVVANRVESETEGVEIYNKIDTVSSKFLNTKLQFLGSVLQDKNASMAVIEQKPLVQTFPNTIASKGIYQLVAKLMDETIVEYKKKEGIARVFIDFFRSKKRIR
ncbi:MAG: MinD/ParA family protein [Wujia sp.]